MRLHTVTLAYRRYFPEVRFASTIPRQIKTRIKRWLVVSHDWRTKLQVCFGMRNLVIAHRWRSLFQPLSGTSGAVRRDFFQLFNLGEGQLVVSIFTQYGSPYMV